MDSATVTRSTSPTCFCSTCWQEQRLRDTRIGFWQSAGHRPQKQRRSSGGSHPKMSERSPSLSDVVHGVWVPEIFGAGGLCRLSVRH